MKTKAPDAGAGIVDEPTIADAFGALSTVAAALLEAAAALAATNPRPQQRARVAKRMRALVQDASLLVEVLVVLARSR